MPLLFNKKDQFHLPDMLNIRIFVLYKKKGK